jgi:eukaryotic-like serine/threonine-protein kinase
VTPHGVAVGTHITPDVLAWHQLGEGPHCATWAGWSLSRWCPVVVKVPHAEAALDRAAAALRREYGFIALLRHPGVISVYEARLDGRHPYIVVEAIEGDTLTSVINAGRMPVRDVIRLGLQLLSITQYLHRNGIAHLDLKPDNVMIRNGRAIVIDFGAAQTIGTSMSRGPRGTDGYMAPEQESAEPASVAMDLYSLGVILAEALAGGAETLRTMWRRRSNQAPAILQDLIASMIETTPGHRPAGASAALATLSQLETADGQGWAPMFAVPHLQRPVPPNVMPIRDLQLLARSIP